MILDTEIDGGLEFIGAVTESYGARVIACTAKAGEDSVLAAMEAGAVGFLCKETLVPDALAAAVRAAYHGAGVMAPDLLATLLKGLTPESVDGRGPISRLTAREQQVLSLIADGHPTREVAQQLLLLGAHRQERAPRHRHEVQREVQIAGRRVRSA